MSSIEGITEINGDVDIGIVTIRDDEFKAVLKRLNGHKPYEGRQYYNFKKIGTKGDTELGVAVVKCLRQGQGYAQGVASDLIHDLNPSWIFLVGIAGGIPCGEYSLGDVALATQLNDFSVSAAIQGEKPEFNVSGASMHRDVENLLANIEAFDVQLKGWNHQKTVKCKKPTVDPPDLESDLYYGSDDWKKDVQGSLQSNFVPGKRLRSPKLVTAPTISSNTLVKDADLAQQWLTSARHTATVEMELGGVYDASRRSNDNEGRIIAIRGISDIIGFKRSGEWTEYACQTAASFAFALMTSGIINSCCRQSGPNYVTTLEIKHDTPLTFDQSAFKSVMSQVTGVDISDAHITDITDIREK